MQGVEISTTLKESMPTLRLFDPGVPDAGSDAPGSKQRGPYIRIGPSGLSMRPDGHRSPSRARPPAVTSMWTCGVAGAADHLRRGRLQLIATVDTRPPLR